jgi:ribosomal protein S18 acetylase RimI-like enzyme
LGTIGSGRQDQQVIELRSAQLDDVAAIAHLDLGAAHDPWLNEVREILSGVVSWSRSPLDQELDRQVVVVCEGDLLVGVVAHELIQDRDHRVRRHERYVMVAAIAARHQRNGLATAMLNSVFNNMATTDTRWVTWLVHPGNRNALRFSRKSFPDADETSPVVDDPYVAFTLQLR